MTTLTPLAIVAAIVAALTQVDDPITAALAVAFAGVLAYVCRPTRPRPHKPGDKLL